MLIGSNVVLSWNMPESNGAPITRFELQFKKDEGDWGDHDGADGSGENEGADPDDPANDVILIEETQDEGDMTVPPATSYIHQNLAGDAIYTYRIRAVSTVNDGDAVTGTARKWSAEVVAETDPGDAEAAVMPGIPAFTDPPLVANNEDGQIEVSWIEPSEGTSPITSYQIQRWTRFCLGTPSHQPGRRGHQVRRYRCRAW